MLATVVREHRGWVALLLVMGVVAVMGALFLPLPAPPAANRPAAPAQPRAAAPQGGPGDDLLAGTEGPDQIRGLAGADRIDGRGGADTLTGGKGADVVAGGDGDDWISGDLGDDTLTGGRGADVFHFAPGCGQDRVTDFDAAHGDRIVLEPGTAYAARQEGADTVVELPGGRIVLAGVNFLKLPGGWIEAS